MTSTASQSTPQDKLALGGIAWETYERLVADHAERSAPRFTYDHGILEIMTPFPWHERYNRAVQMLVSAVGEELDINIGSLGSTTFRRRELEMGFEPDSCFYVKNEALVRRKQTIDLSIDPPPDVVLEIEASRSAVSKLTIFEQFRVPEVWRYGIEGLEILALGPDGYTPAATSVALPMVRADAVSELLALIDTLSPTDWMRRVRTWARQLSRDR